MSAPTVLSPAPFQSKFTDKNGMLSLPWANWIRQLYVQTGGSSSTSLSSLINTVAELTTEVSANTEDIATLQTDFNNLSLGHEL